MTKYLLEQKTIFDSTVFFTFTSSFFLVLNCNLNGVINFQESSDMLACPSHMTNLSFCSSEDSVTQTPNVIWVKSKDFKQYSNSEHCMGVAQLNTFNITIFSVLRFIFCIAQVQLFACKHPTKITQIEYSILKVILSSFTFMFNKASNQLSIISQFNLHH